MSFGVATMRLFGRAMLVVALLAPAALVAAPAAVATAPRHYDCSKAGNANKAACKGTSVAAPATPSASRTTKTTTTTKTSERHYDCTKPGNANKAPCKTAAAQTPAGKAAGAVKTTTRTTTTTTDCTKWYNRMRAACKRTSASTPPHTTVAPAPKPVATAVSGASVDRNPAGATAQCKDSTYSHAKSHSGACSHHGGVAKWMS